MPGRKGPEALLTLHFNYLHALGHVFKVSYRQDPGDLCLGVPRTQPFLPQLGEGAPCIGSFWNEGFFPEAPLPPGWTSGGTLVAGYLQ